VLLCIIYCEVSELEAPCSESAQNLTPVQWACPREHLTFIENRGCWRAAWTAWQLQKEASPCIMRGQGCTGSGPWLKNNGACGSGLLVPRLVHRKHCLFEEFEALEVFWEGFELFAILWLSGRRLTSSMVISQSGFRCT
jgi:hypothetical protein